MLNFTSIINNDSKTDDFGHKDKSFQPETIFIVNCVLNTPSMLISVIGNALVLTAILRTPSLHSPSTVFLCSLAISDLLVGLVLQPIFVATGIKPGNYSLLHAYDMLALSVCGVSLCAMAAISVDRFLAVYYHMRYPILMTSKRALYTSSTVWFTSIILSCVRFWNKDIHDLTIAVGTAICLIICSASYIRIYFIVRRHQLQIHVQQQAVESLNAEHNLNMLRSKRSAINTFIYCICMILCYFPVVVSMFILTIFPKRWTRAWSLADSVAFLNSAINPFLYCWRIRELRTAVFKVLPNILFKQTDQN